MRRLHLLAALLVTQACGSNDDPPAPRDLAIGGGFTATIVEGDRLVVASSDGRVLLDGLPPGKVADGGPPLVGFAVRDVTTTYESNFGAFKPTVTPDGAWKVAQKLSGPASAIDLEDADGHPVARISLTAPEPGHLVATITSNEKNDPSHPEHARQISWGFACDEHDHFAGFGEQTWDTDHRGQTVPTFVSEEGVGKSETDDFTGLWQLQGQRHSSQAPIPEYLARRGYALVAKTDRRATFALCSESDTAARIEVDLPAEIHVFDGPTSADAIGRATATFGRPRMPPLVAFAPWIDAIFGSTNVRRVAQKLRDDAIPVSVVWTEDWRGGDWSGDTYALKEEWEVDRSLYPDIEQVASDLHGEGYDFFVYFNPFIYEGSKAWSETEPNGWLIHDASGADYTFEGAKLSDTSMIDLDDPDARAWAVGKMRDAMALGADGWMNDFGEWLPMDAVTDAGPAYDEHNRYPVMWQEVAREAIDGAPDGGERLFFARSAWFGSPPLVDVFWAGDQRTTFDADDGMPTVLPIGIGTGIVGLGSFASDVAGYQAANNAGSTKEVFFRWTELGAWSPVMRTHHGAQPMKNWSWESDAETTAHFKRYASLHMALVPTIAGLAKVANTTGLPVWRGLAIGFGDDEAVWPIKDEVMLGDGLLVAPVASAGATSRPVYLPSGHWYPWNGGAPSDGPTTITADAPLAEIPVFARAGTIVPMFPDGVMTLVHGSPSVPDASSVGDDRVVRVFLGDAGTFSEENGLAYSLEKLGDVASGALDASFTPDGGSMVALAACAPTPAPPCLESSGGETIALVSGPGAITLRQAGSDVARFTATGGAANRSLTIRFAD